MITVRQNDTIQKTRNKRRSKIKNWIIRAVEMYDDVHHTPHSLPHVHIATDVFSSDVPYRYHRMLPC